MDEERDHGTISVDTETAFGKIQHLSVMEPLNQSSIKMPQIIKSAHDQPPAGTTGRLYPLHHSAAPSVTFFTELEKNS